MRHYKRAETVDGVKWILRAEERWGLGEARAQEMYRYLAIANYEDRFVVPRDVIVKPRVTHSRRKTVVALPRRWLPRA